MSSVPKNYFSGKIIDSRQLLDHIIFLDQEEKIHIFTLNDIVESFKNIDNNNKNVSDKEVFELAKIYNIHSMEKIFFYFTDQKGIIEIYSEEVKPIILKINIDLNKSPLVIDDTIFKIDKNTTIYFPFNEHVMIFSSGIAVPIIMKSLIKISYDKNLDNYSINFIKSDK